MTDVKILTNGHRRDVLDASQLTAAERADFDYLDWSAIDNGTESASFFRYRGTLYDLSEFTADYGITRGTGLPSVFAGWDGYLTDSAFSAVLVRYVDDFEGVVVGLALS